MSVFIFRSLPLNADSRTMRNGEIFHNQRVEYFTWEALSGKHVNRHFFRVGKTGSSLLKIVKFLLFSLWVGFKVLGNAKKDDYVILMDLETVIFGIFAAKIKRAKVIFDIVDPAAQTKTNNKIAQRFLDFLEVSYSRFADYVFVPHGCRLSYYIDKGMGPLSNDNIVVVENVPNLDAESRTQADSDRVKVSIGYFGTLDPNSRGLEWLLEFANKYKEKYDVLLAGRGRLESEIERQVLLSDNIFFEGSFSSGDLRELYAKVDVSWAYYTPRIDLHRYAAPNKYYEHLYFTTPLIISSCIPQSVEINKLNSGVEVDAESFTDAEYAKFDEALNVILLDKHELKRRLYEVWESQYKNYYSILRKNLVEHGIAV